MDSYSELSFHNAVACLPLDVHLDGKSNVDECDCDEHFRNEGNNSTFKMTFTDINEEDAAAIDNSEVSLGDVMAEHGVADLEQGTFLCPEGNPLSIPLSQQTTSLVIDNSQDEVLQVVTNDSITRALRQINNIKDEPSSKFQQETIEEIHEMGVNCEVDHAIASILNSVTSRDINMSNESKEEKKSGTNNSMDNSKGKDASQKGKANKKSKTEEKHECTICGKTFREKSHLATHSRAHVDIRNFNCDICGLRFKTKANLYFHSQTHSEAPFTCTECNKTFAERKILKRHIRVVHSCKEVHKCNQCDKTFKSAAILSLHYTLHTGSKPFRCSMCPKSFVYKSTLAMHISSHHQCTSCLPSACRHRARPWLCTVCGKGYSLKATLNTHMKSHDPDKLFKCNECSKTFVKKQSYDIHMKLHTGEGPQYMCDQCSQSYFNVFALRRHYMKHTSQRNFVCEVCSKAFWMKDALKVHMRSHSNEKPYQCNRCPKAFAYKHKLEGHMKMHQSTLEITNTKKEVPLSSTPLTTVVPPPPPPIPPQSFLFYQLPPPLQPATHIVLTHTDQNTSHTLHVL